MAAAIWGIVLIANMAGCVMHTAGNGRQEDTVLEGSEASAGVYAIESTAIEYDGALEEDGTAAGQYGAAYVSGISTEAERKQRLEVFSPYSQYGMAYDEDKDELRYHGEVVRWFEDYYPLGEGMSGGLDFFDEDGVVDVHGVRDLSKVVTNGDGSTNPAGKLVGLEAFSETEFAARDVEAIKNPPVPVAYAIEGGGEPNEAELEKMAAEYQPFGVMYDAKKDQWYFKGEKVRYFQDILTSNGESPNSGKFKGSMRSFGNEDGTIDIQAVRDYGKPNAEGNGTLTGIRKCICLY